MAFSGTGLWPPVVNRTAEDFPDVRPAHIVDSVND
jgi:hypothetical protein